MNVLIAIALSGAGLIALILLALDAQYRRRLGNKMDLSSGKWELQTYEKQHYKLVGDLEFHNYTERLEVMAPEIDIQVTLLSGDSLDGITTSSRLLPRFKGSEVRADGYWEGCIVKPGEPCPIEIQVDVRGEDLTALKAAWIKIHYMTYGPQGRVPKLRHVVVPLKFPSIEESNRWRPTASADVLPVKTHLLTHLDDPVEIVKRYVVPHSQPGDIVTLGESPVAIMQGRFRYPGDVKPGWLAKRLCYMFMPTSSLATACGLQVLVDIVGPTRVFFGFVMGSLGKLVGKKGVFYQMAGEQARLIDDVTGTIPPYDKFIVMGPHDPQSICDRIKRETGLSAAIVDVNDLKRVKILAATADLTQPLLEQALISNPAGNANEQTPVVLIRPTESSRDRVSANLQSVQ